MINHKEAAIDFLTLVAAGNVDEANDKHIAPTFRHHNAYFAGDRDSLKSAMKENAAKNPNKTLDVKFALADADKVAVLSHVRQNPADRGAAVVHIFRFEGDRVVELWDLGQPVPEQTPNENGMF